MRIWITRTEPGATATAQRLRALGHEPLVRPLIEAAAVPGRLDADGVGALAFTSANGVRFFLEAAAGPGALTAPDAWLALPVFAVGGATAKAAAEAGFANVVSADGDVEALAALIVSRREVEPDPARRLILHPSAAEPAGDLTGALGASGIEARRAIVYRTSPVSLNEGALDDALACEAVMLHSPRAGRQLAELLRGRTETALTAFCLSAAVAAPLLDARLGAVRVANAPDDSALLALLDGGTAAPASAVDSERVRLLTPLFWSMMLLSAAGMAAAALMATALVVRHVPPERTPHALSPRSPSR